MRMSVTRVMMMIIDTIKEKRTITIQLGLKGYIVMLGCYQIIKLIVKMRIQWLLMLRMMLLLECLLYEFLRDLELVIFISDKQKRLMNALETYYPITRSRHCVKHVYANFRKNFSSIHLRTCFSLYLKQQIR